MLEKVTLSNFKSAGSTPVSLEPKPLTILTGPNGSGKSSILEAIAVVTQALRLTSLPRSLERSMKEGELVRFPNINAISHKGELRSLRIELGFNLSKIDQKKLDTRASLLNYSFLKNLRSNNVIQEIKLGKRRRRVARIFRYNREGEPFVDFSTLLRNYTLRGDFGASELLSDELFRPKQDHDLPPNTLNRFGPKERAQRIGQMVRGINNSLREISNYASILKRNMKRVFFISTQRGRVDFEVKVSERMPYWVGPNGEHLIELLSAIFSQRKFSSIAERIVEWSEKFEISGLKAGWRGRNMLRSDFEDRVLKTPLDLPLASYGSRQVLTLIAQIFWSQPNDVIMIEEPEISLHPQSQVVLQELFAKAVEDHKQIIITTHSPILVLALSKIIQMNKIDREKVAVYEIRKTRFGSKARALDINDRGYLENWIPSFKTVEDELFDEWAKSLD